MTSIGLDIHHTSSLPSILDKYMSPGLSKQNDKKKNLKKKSLAMKNEDGNEEGFPETSRSDPEEEARIREKAALDQHHLEVYRNIHLLQDVMHRRYAALLKEKIHKQRQEIRQRGMSIPKPKENPPKKVSQKADGTVGQRLPHRTLSHNDKYLKSLPKTSYYLIVDLQNQLARLGCLKTRQDHEEFWSMVGQNQGAARLEMRLREIREKMMGGRMAQKETLEPVPTVMIAAHGGSHQEPTVLSKGEAVDCRAAHQLQGKHPQEWGEIEQMFPKVNIPKSVTLQSGFLDQFKPSTLPQLKACEPPQRTAELSLRKLHLMYSRSLINIATTKRLLDGNRHFQRWEEENSVRSLIQYVFPNDDTRVKQRCTGKQSLPLQAPTTTLRETPLPSPQSITPSPAGTISTELIQRETEVVSPKPPDPLTLEEVSQQSLVVIDRLCKTWTNYVENSNMH